MDIITLTVEGMSCSHCENSIKKALTELNGIHSVAVELAHKKVVVEYDAAKIDRKIISETIEDQGYDVIR